jgi:hypothetical protein
MRCAICKCSSHTVLCAYCKVAPATDLRTNHRFDPTDAYGEYDEMDNGDSAIMNDGRED